MPRVVGWWMESRADVSECPAWGRRRVGLGRVERGDRRVIGVSCVRGACFVKTWRYRARGELGNTLRRSEVRVQTFGTLFMCHVWFCVLNFDPA